MVQPFLALEGSDAVMGGKVQPPEQTTPSRMNTGTLLMHLMLW